MYRSSEAFRVAVAASGHEAVAGLDLLTSSGQVERELRVLSGSVTEDGAASVRRTLDATVLDDGGLLPLDASPLFPGALLRPWRGVVLPDGTTERIPLGVFVSGKPDADLDAGTIAVAAEDRSAAVARAQLVDPWPVPGASWLSQVVSAFLRDRLPGCPMVALAGSDVQIVAETMLPAGADTDPWTALTSTEQDTPGLVHAAGRRLWFDADGVPTLYPLGASALPTVVDSSRLVLASRTAIDPERSYGGVCVTSNVFGDEDPLRSILWDETARPAWAKRVHFASMDAIDNQDDLDAAAGALLTTVTGIKGQASCAMPPDPTRQVGDLLRLVGGPLVGDFEVARIVTPLGAGLQQIDFLERAV